MFAACSVIQLASASSASSPHVRSSVTEGAVPHHLSARPTRAGHQGATIVPAIGPTEIIVLLVIALLVFGPKRLPSLGRSLGGGLREFKDSVTGSRRHDAEVHALEAETAAPVQ
jgi:sec-independent protein translocase protein TatA